MTSVMPMYRGSCVHVTGENMEICQKYSPHNLGTPKAREMGGAVPKSSHRALLYISKSKLYHLPERS